MSLDVGQYPSVSRAEQTTSYTGGSDYVISAGITGSFLLVSMKKSGRNYTKAQWINWKLFM